MIWQAAQQAEKEMWEHVLQDPYGLLQSHVNMYNFLVKIRNCCPNALTPPGVATTSQKGEAVEVGIGAWGISLLSLLGHERHNWRITGVDPMPRMSITCFYPHISAYFKELLQQDIIYIQAPFEQAELPSEYYNLAICYNVLDHVESPAKTMREIHRVLRPGGFLILGVDCLCLINWFRHKYFLEDISHPHKFTAWHYKKLIIDNGFDLVFFERGRKEILSRIIGKARRLAAVAVKS